MAKKERKPEKTPETEKPEQTAAEETPEKEGGEELAQLQASLDAANDKYLRLAAEYDNYRKRSAKERTAIFDDVRSDTIVKILPVYDNLARALAQETSDEAYRRGIEMTMTQFLDILSGMGVVPIEALGEKFDPTKHNAVMHVEDEEAEENVIVEEFQKGFIMGEKVIRFSMVKVAN